MTDYFDVFKSEALVKFNFLITDFNFTPREEGSKLIIFESDRVRVELYFDRSRLEFDLSFGRKDNKQDWEHGFTIDHLRLLNGLGQVGVETHISSVNDLKNWVFRYAEDLQKFGKLALQGDDSFYADLHRQSKKWNEEALKNSNLSSAMFHQKRNN